MSEGLDKLEQKVAVTAKSMIAFANLQDMKTFGDEIVRTGLTPLKTGGAVVAAILFGQELGLTPMVSVNNIYPIGGKATLGVHLINSLLTKAGITMEIIRDYDPCVDFVMKAEDGKAVCLDKDTGAEMKRGEDGKSPKGSVPVFLRQGFADEPAKDHEVKGKRVTNFKTVLKFTRLVRRLDGGFVETSVVSSFSFQEANVAGLLSNPAWQKYPKTMTMNRAISIGGRLIADDILMGFPETTEYADVHKMNYTVEDGKFTILDNSKKDETLNTSELEPATEISEENADTSTNNVNNQNTSSANQTN